MKKKLKKCKKKIERRKKITGGNKVNKRQKKNRIGNFEAEEEKRQV